MDTEDAEDLVPATHDNTGRIACSYAYRLKYLNKERLSIEAYYSCDQECRFEDYMKRLIDDLGYDAAFIRVTRPFIHPDDRIKFTRLVTSRLTPRAMLIVSCMFYNYSYDAMNYFDAYSDRDYDTACTRYYLSEAISTLESEASTLEDVMRAILHDLARINYVRRMYNERRGINATMYPALWDQLSRGIIGTDAANFVKIGTMIVEDNGESGMSTYVPLVSGMEYPLPSPMMGETIAGGPESTQFVKTIRSRDTGKFLNHLYTWVRLNDTHLQFNVYALVDETLVTYGDIIAINSLSGVADRYVVGGLFASEMHATKGDSDTSILTKPLTCMRSGHDMAFMSRQIARHVDVETMGIRDMLGARGVSMLKDGMVDKITAAQISSLQFVIYCESFDAGSSQRMRFTDVLEGRGSTLDNTEYPDITQARHGGIIANGTGTGKTLVVIMACLMRSRIEARATRPSALVILPPDLVTHWVEEIEKHTKLIVFNRIGARWTPPDEPYALILTNSGSVNGYQGTFRFLRSAKRPKMVIVTPNIRRSKAGRRFMQGRKWSRIFVEEAHLRCSMMDLFSCETPASKSIFAVTATPYENFPQIANMIMGFRSIYQDEEGGVTSTQVMSGASTSTDNRMMPMLKYMIHSHELELEGSEMKVEVVMCENGDAEEAFFSVVDDIIRESLLYNAPNSRFFRILERCTGGGRIHADLMIRVLRHVVAQQRERKRRRDEVVQPHRSNLTSGDIVGDKQAATDRAKCERGDSCAVCTGQYEEPVQVQCGHVYCTVCINAAFQAGLTDCPLCRYPMKTVYTPWFSDDPDQEKKEVDEEQPADVTTDTTTPKSVEDGDAAEFRRGILDPQNYDDADGVMTMRGKMDAFTKRMREWSDKRDKGRDRLIIFVQYTSAAVQYRELIRRIDPSLVVSSAGLFGCNRVESVCNITAFKNGEADVLFMSPAYCTGHDLSVASELWIVGVTMKVCQSVQAMGRIYRLSQSAPQVRVLVFINPGTFGHYMWDHRYFGRIPSTKRTLRHFQIWRTKNKFDEILNGDLQDYDVSVHNMFADLQQILQKHPRDMETVLIGYDTVLVDFKVTVKRYYDAYITMIRNSTEQERRLCYVGRDQFQRMCHESMSIPGETVLQYARRMVNSHAVIPERYEQMHSVREEMNAILDA